MHEDKLRAGHHSGLDWNFMKKKMKEMMERKFREGRGRYGRL
jgi:hypothetical protein